LSCKGKAVSQNSSTLNQAWLAYSKRLLTVQKKSLMCFVFQAHSKMSKLRLLLLTWTILMRTLCLFVNSVRTVDGGTHVQGLRSAISKTLAEVGRRKGLLKDNNVSSDDFRQGLRAVVAVRVPEPEFEGQTKGKLGSKYVRNIVEDVVSKAFESYLETQNDVTKTLIQRALASAEMRETFKRTREMMKNRLRVESTVLPGKLSDCSSRDVEKRELLIVEGESAGGSAKQGRDRTIQAVLPLRGKILNVEKASWKRVFG